ncbi:RhtB (resistance to homoserine/threonine) family protein [Rhizobium sp. PP-F2F-G20b]|nr:RhtB (resistance to homoserine/threonine) family protein [Rhizobium sp. PP-F2F-G20b]
MELSVHPYLFELASLMAIFAFAIVAPGADLAMVMRQSILHGRRSAILTSFGVGTSLMVHVTYTILGLGLVISQSITLFNIVKWCGVAYLLYIGIKALKAKPAETLDVAAPEPVARGPQSAFTAFGLGFAANALNPKPVFFFLSIFSTVVSTQTPVAVKFGYGLVMASCLILWFVAVSLFMTTPAMRARFARISHWIDRASGMVFIALGLKLATEKAA